MEPADGGISELWKLLFGTVEDIRNYHGRSTPFRPKSDLTVSQIRLLGCLILNRDGSMRVKDIAEELGITPGGVSQIADSLVKSGMITRIQDENDRRAVQVSLSRHGLNIRTKIDASFDGMFERFLKDVPRTEREVFMKVLKTMRDAVRAEKKELKK